MKLNPNLNHERFEAAFRAIDTHTVGEVTRIVLSGFPKLKGNSMMERKQFLEEHCEHYRKALMFEPRGHHDMFGALLTDPASKEADLGVIFMETGGYLNMCGHATIGSATAIVEAGLVPVTEPYTEVVLEAPAGIIRTQVKVENGKAVHVTLTNVPSFLYLENQEIEIDGKKIVYDISFGGSFFALVDTTKIGIEVNAANIPEITDIGMKLLDKINKTVKVQHPTLDITSVDLIEFYGPATDPEANLKNVVIFGDGMADRSPCGTGTSAKLAALYARKKIGIGEAFIYESFIGSKFKGFIKETTRVGKYDAVIPLITGSAYVTSDTTYLIDKTDPLKYGFQVGV